MYSDGKAYADTALILKSNIKHYKIDKYQMYICRLLVLY